MNISSHIGHCAQRIAVVVRNHWRVEPELYWTMDVCFGEDDSRIRISTVLKKGSSRQ